MTSTLSKVGLATEELHYVTFHIMRDLRIIRVITV
jgi:hypothetical protein